MLSSVTSHLIRSHVTLSSVTSQLTPLRDLRVAAVKTPSSAQVRTLSRAQGCPTLQIRFGLFLVALGLFSSDPGCLGAFMHEMLPFFNAMPPFINATPPEMDAMPPFVDAMPPFMAIVLTCAAVMPTCVVVMLTCVVVMLTCVA
eukprot:1486546-Rhodomonas_salina.1